MSQNKTRVQGLEEMDSISSAQPNFQQNPVGNGFYQRNMSNTPAHNGTVVSGMGDYRESQAAQQPTPPPTPQQLHQPAPVFAEGTPVVGFLYSVSRSMFGEYWPLHIGKNTIGNNPDNSIVLGEGTVSGSHAILQVRRAKNTGKISAWISDVSSTNGTMVNDDCLGSMPMDCKNGDIITFGDNYQCYLTLIDASVLGLKVSEDFMPVQVASAPVQNSPIQGTNPADTATAPFDPWGNGGATTGSEYEPSRGTIGLDGSTGINKGGTITL